MPNEAETVAKLAVEAAAVHTVAAQPGAAGYHIVPEGHSTEWFDHEALLNSPRRAIGSVAVHDGPSLVLYVRKHGSCPAPELITGDTQRGPAAQESRTALYADVDHVTVTGVINGHGPGDVNPGWADHRAVLTLRHSPEWAHWSGSDRKWMDQVSFAQHIEEGDKEIVDPPAADMLDIAQTLEVNNRVDWRGQTLLANGQRQFTYHETVDARAGQTGTLNIPTKFQLGLIVFEGQTTGYRVNARFQFQLREGVLKLRYLLDRPHDVIRTAFGDVVGDVEAGTGLAAFRGVAPR